jgi:hypothetical protein
MGTDLLPAAELVDELDRIISGPNAKLDTVLSYIPGLFGTSNKATYLGFRAIGLTVDQALEVLQKDYSDYLRWCEQSPEFRDFELNHLPILQSRVGADLIRLAFLRNMTMLMWKDQEVIMKSMTGRGLQDMSDRDFTYFRQIRRFYTTSDLKALQSAVEPEKHRANVLVLQIGNGRQFEVIDDGDEGQPQLSLIEGQLEEAG